MQAPILRNIVIVLAIGIVLIIYFNKIRKPKTK